MSGEDLTPKQIDDIAALHTGQFNTGAMVTTLSFLKGAFPSETRVIRGLTDDWTEVNCPDGGTAKVLKKPAKAFELYATQWTTKIKAITDILNQYKIDAEGNVDKKIVSLFNDLDYIEAALREMYKNSYLTFAATPCSEKAQEEKRRMDRIVTASSLHLVSFKIILESNGVKNFDLIYKEMLKMIDKIINMIIQ